VLAYTVLMLAAQHLPPSYSAGAAFLLPLFGLAAAWVGGYGSAAFDKATTVDLTKWKKGSG